MDEDLMADAPAGMNNEMRTLVHMHDLLDQVTLDGMVVNIDRQYGTI